MSNASRGGVVDIQGRTFKAAAAGQKKGLFVVLGSDDSTAATAAAANAPVIGVQVDDSSIVGEAILIAESGDVKLIVGAAVAAGDYLVTDASGRAVKSAATGDYVRARAITAGAAAGDVIVARLVEFIR